MFDLSLAEMAVIGAVALVVIGPEKLPKVARTAGLLLGRAQRMVASVKAELDREMHNAELAQLQAEVEKEADEIAEALPDAGGDDLHALQDVPTETLPDPLPAVPAPAAVDERQLDLFAEPLAPSEPVRDRR